MLQIDFSQDLDLEKISCKTDFEEQVLAFLKEWFSSSKTVQVQTSGSTGTPKVFQIEKNRMRASAKLTCDFLGLNEGNTALLCLPIEYISGKMMLVRALERKLKIFVGTLSSTPLLGLDQEIDFCAMTPLQVEKSLDKIRLIKNLIIGGAAVSPNLKNQIFSNLSGSQNNIFETYGMSETLSHIALKHIFPFAADYFKVFDGIKVTKDERGCLTIEAPMLNAEILHTNDIVEFNTANQFKFIGRVDHVINSGGAKITPEALEALAKKYCAEEIVFSAVPDDMLGQKLVAVVECSKKENQYDVREKLLSLPYERSFHKPKEIFFVDDLPRTENGKLDRLAVARQIIHL